MIRHAFKMKLKPGVIDEYKKRHDELWPELAKELRDAGISDVGIVVSDDRFVHAPSRGQDIKVSSLDEPYFVRGWVGGRRFF